MANLPYDKHSAASIFEYSKGLLGKSLRAFGREDYLPKKGKGLIRVARIGNKAEINKGSKDTDPRLVFELEYLESLPEYKPVKLNIFNTFRDTVLASIL